MKKDVTVTPRPRKIADHDRFYHVFSRDVHLQLAAFVMPYEKDHFSRNSRRKRKENDVWAYQMSFL